MDRAKIPLSRFLEQSLDHPLAAKALTLKILNLLLAKHHFGRRSAIVHSRPFGLVVDPSNGCQLQCPGCVHSGKSRTFQLFDWKGGMLSEDRFDAFLRVYGPTAIQIVFCNYGEPLLNPNTPRFIARTKDYYAQTTVSTSLSVKRFDAEAYVRSGLDFLYLSIDGATPETYRKFRRNGDLDLVFRNIETLVATKRRLGSVTPILRWQFLAFEHNRHEIGQALDTARAFGLNHFALCRPFDVTWDDPEIRIAEEVEPYATELISHTEHLLGSNWPNSANRSSVASDAEAQIQHQFENAWAGQAESGNDGTKEQGHTCGWLYKNMTMDANGRILPCCSAPKPGFELVFDTFKEPTQGSFNAKQYQRARAHFAPKTPDEQLKILNSPEPHCTTCEWDQTHVEIGPGEVSQFLRSAGKEWIGADSIQLLANW